MAQTKAMRKAKQNQTKLLQKLKVEQGDYTGMYIYLANAEMSVTKDAVVDRPHIVVGLSSDLGYLLMPHSKNPLIEVHHTPIKIGTSEMLSYQAPNEAFWVKELSVGMMKHLNHSMWQQVLLNTQQITNACKKDAAINSSLNDWLSKAKQAGLA